MGRIAKGSVAIQMLLLVALACAVRLPRLAEPIGGFHGFNEANYLLEAKNFRHGSFLVPTVDGTTPFIESPLAMEEIVVTSFEDYHRHGFAVIH